MQEFVPVKYGPPMALSLNQPTLPESPALSRLHFISEHHLLFFSFHFPTPPADAAGQTQVKRGLDQVCFSELSVY